MAAFLMRLPRECYTCRAVWPTEITSASFLILYVQVYGKIGHAQSTYGSGHPEREGPVPAPKFSVVHRVS
jgi:hypothetical protein